MSFANPTSLRLGMTGTLAGKRYRVAGRIVMSMDDDGITYYWNEFNLVNDEDESATLVYEETERGGEWKLFIYIEPSGILTAAEAATKQVGDRLEIDGTSVCVTLVDESSVYYIEGEAPEGVEVNDIARYFNAESGNTMIVVSWTGDEVEYYRGINLPRGTIQKAFGISEPVAGSAWQSESLFSLGSGSTFSGQAWSASQKFLPVLIVLFILLIFALKFQAFGFRLPAHSVKRINAPVSSLKLGNTGKLNGMNWHVRSHAIVEVSQVGRIYERHEYHLVDDDGNESLLVHGCRPGVDDWFHFTALNPLEPMPPQRAATLRVGEPVNVDGVIVPVGEIFQSVIRQVEITNTSAPVLQSGDVFFGFGGQTGMTRLESRWNERGITFQKGMELKAAAVVAAFGLKK